MRVAILSDIHANSEALEAVLAHMEPRRVDAVWFLGDAVGYGADAELVIDWLGSAGLSSVVRGNHDKVVAGIEEPDTFSPIALRFATIYGPPRCRPQDARANLAGGGRSPSAPAAWPRAGDGHGGALPR